MTAALALSLAAVGSGAPTRSAQKDASGTAAIAPAGVDPGADFNADGFADLAIGVPNENVDSVSDVGAIQVIYGSRDGLNGDTPIDDQFWTENEFERSTFVSERDDFFGSSLAAGDFDGDGFDDLAIGVPWEDVNTAGSSIKDAGAVYVLPGSRSGLTIIRMTLLTQNTAGVLDSVEPGDLFGASLAAGNFGRGSSFDDLAIGVRGENLGSAGDAGAVNVIYGSSQGLSGTKSQLLHQGGSRVPGTIEAGDRFGSSLAAANLGRSGEDDLAVGVAHEDISGAIDAGAVDVIYGSPAGLGFGRGQLWHQNKRGIPGTPAAQGEFGFALAAADFGRGKQADLAVGAPTTDIGGAVDVLYGSTSGLTAYSVDGWTQASAGIAGNPNEGDQFGFALAGADFGIGVWADLAIGAPGDEGRIAGAVNVLHGSRTGLSSSGNEYLYQDSSTLAGKIEGDSEDFDRFGWSLTGADFGKGPVADLAIGVPGESKEGATVFNATITAVGAVNVMYGDEYGLRATDDQFWWQASDYLHDKAEFADQFGLALTR